MSMILYLDFIWWHGPKIFLANVAKLEQNYSEICLNQQIKGGVEKVEQNKSKKIVKKLFWAFKKFRICKQETRQNGQKKN